MGLLDSVLGAAAQAGGGQSQAVALVSQLLRQNGGSIGGLLEQLKQGGLGDALQSWIGSGGNQNVDGSQIQHALGGGLQEAAQKLGLDVGQAGSLLAQYLPNIIDVLTPNGKAADADGFGLDDIVRIAMQQLGK